MTDKSLSRVLGTSTGVVIAVVPIDVSKSWTPDARFIGKKALVHVVGGGGSGAVCSDANARATGGGAAAHEVKEITLTNTPYAATVAAGGIAASVSSTNDANGSAGGNSSFIGDGHNIVANGGAGGIFGNTGTIAGGAGGTGSGGDYGYDGGSGGACSGNNSASGGGCVGLFDTGLNGGDATANNSATGGGNFGGAAPARGTSGVGTAGLPLLFLTSGKMFGDSTPGASSAGSGPVSPDVATAGASGGRYDTAGGSINSGVAKFGCGSGGAVCTASCNKTSGTGGDGYIFIEILG